MPTPQPLPERDPQWWLHDAATVRVGWAWWLVLAAVMAVFMWGLRDIDRSPFVPVSCVWLGAFACCMIFHVEALKRVLSLRAEVEKLRQIIEERGSQEATEKPRDTELY
jgi:hypothetical protein